MKVYELSKDKLNKRIKIIKTANSFLENKTGFFVRLEGKNGVVIEENNTKRYFTLYEGDEVELLETNNAE